MRAWPVVLAFLVATVAPVAAQQATFQDALLDKMAGDWVLSGAIAGDQTTHDISAHWVLKHQYLSFHEIARELGKDGRPIYEATVHIGWDGPGKQYVCVWLDDFGGASTQTIGHAVRDGDSLPFVFVSPDGSRFHTTFTYLPQKDQWTMTMDAEMQGKFSPFARTTWTRPPAAPAH